MTRRKFRVRPSDYTADRWEVCRWDGWWWGGWTFLTLHTTREEAMAHATRLSAASDGGFTSYH